MYFLYVYESGDPGRYMGSNTPHFILSGLLVPEQDWKAGLARMLAFRAAVKEATGLAKKIAFHSSELVRPHKLEVYINHPQIGKYKATQGLRGPVIHFLPQRAYPERMPRQTATGHRKQLPGVGMAQAATWLR